MSIGRLHVIVHDCAHDKKGPQGEADQVDQIPKLQKVGVERHRGIPRSADKSIEGVVRHDGTRLGVNHLADLLLFSVVQIITIVTLKKRKKKTSNIYDRRVAKNKKRGEACSLLQQTACWFFVFLQIFLLLFSASFLQYFSANKKFVLPSRPYLVDKMLGDEVLREET
jgi:hypothetical protein